MANPVWLAQEDSLSDEDEWHSRPGGLRFYRRGADKPELAQGAAMPNAILIHLDKQLSRAQDVAAMRDPSQGRNPPGVRSASDVL